MTREPGARATQFGLQKQQIKVFGMVLATERELDCVLAAMVNAIHAFLGVDGAMR